MDFLHTAYRDQVPWAVDVCNIEFVSVPNLSNYDYFFINFESFREECSDCVHIWYSYQIPCIAHACKITFKLCDKLEYM